MPFRPQDRGHLRAEGRDHLVNRGLHGTDVGDDVTVLADLWRKLFVLERVGFTMPSFPYYSGDRTELAFDASAAERDLGWRPTPYAEALRTTIRWFLEHELVYGQSFDVPVEGDFTVPIGRARIARKARHLGHDAEQRWEDLAFALKEAARGARDRFRHRAAASAAADDETDADD